MYVITTNRKRAAQAKHDYEKIYGGATIYQYTDIYMVTACFKKGVLMKEFDKRAIFVLGTIFHAQAFNETLLDSYNNFDDFCRDLKQEQQSFFGHYVVVLIDEGIIEVISDRVGLINTYYSQINDNDVAISDDLLEVSRVSENKELCAQAVYEFLLTESNVGRLTIFNHIFRLGFGKQLVVKDGKITEKDIYHYTIEKLRFEEYVERIETYFGCFGHYRGRITSDLSAGYDTRTICAIAHKTLGQFAGFTNVRQDDGGCDGQTSKLIAQKLQIPFYYVDYSEEQEPDEKNYLEALRETTVLRDAKRSQRWPILFAKKYGGCELAFGGLGGEVLRGKYNDFNKITDFIAVYYRGNEAEKVCGFKRYSENVRRELNDYRMPLGIDTKLLPNWYYAIAKMRIWGSGCIHHALLYGDVVHPLMDWYLLNPIFGFEDEELRDAQLQMRLILAFAPELKGIPINGITSERQVSLGATLRTYACRLPKVRAIGTNLRCRYRNRKEKSQLDIPQNIPLELKRVFAVETQALLTSKGKSIADRMQTILSAYAYVK